MGIESRLYQVRASSSSLQLGFHSSSKSRSLLIKERSFEVHFCSYAINLVEMATYLWRKYADYVHTKWERMILWNMVEPYMRPKSFTPLVTIYIAGFYSGVIASAITEQLYKVFLFRCICDSWLCGCFFWGLC